MHSTLTSLSCAWRDAVRSVRHAAGLNIGIVTTLPIAAGVNLAMLGLVDRLLLSPPRHLEDPSRLMRVTFARDGTNGRGGATSTTSFPAFEALRDHVPAFTRAGAFVARSMTAAIGDERLQIDAAVVSGGYFDALGSAPFSGRLLREADDRAEAEPAIVVSYRLWKARRWAGASASADTRIALWLAGISALVFVTGIANAGTLLLIAATRRGRDIAVRAALGASRRGPGHAVRGP